MAPILLGLGKPIVETQTIFIPTTQGSYGIHYDGGTLGQYNAYSGNNAIIGETNGDNWGLTAVFNIPVSLPRNTQVVAAEFRGYLYDNLITLGAGSIYPHVWGVQADNSPATTDATSITALMNDATLADLGNGEIVESSAVGTWLPSISLTPSHFTTLFSRVGWVSGNTLNLMVRELAPVDPPSGTPARYIAYSQHNKNDGVGTVSGLFLEYYV